MDATLAGAVAARVGGAVVAVSTEGTDTPVYLEGRVFLCAAWVHPRLSPRLRAVVDACPRIGLTVGTPPEA